MKKIFILGLVLVASTVSAHSFVVSPFVGYSNIRGYVDGFTQSYVVLPQGYVESEALPSNVGTALLGFETGVSVRDKFEFGLEFVYPFGYVFNSHLYEATYKIMQIGPYGKYYFHTNYFNPYLKIGLAYYWGKEKYKPWKSYPELIIPTRVYDVDGNWVVSVGAGILLDLGVFIQFDYNFAVQGDKWIKVFDMDTWDVRVGYKFSFGH